MHLQGVCLSEARNLFFQTCIFCHFQWTWNPVTAVSSIRLQTYCPWLWLSSGGCENYISQRPAHLRVSRYKWFQWQNWDDKGEWVYDFRGGGDYIAWYQWRATLEEYGPRLFEKINETHAIPWPPRVGDLEEAEERCGLLIQLLRWLTKSRKPSSVQGHCPYSWCIPPTSKLLQLFSMEPVTEIPQGYISLVDMGLIWRLATPTPEDREAKRRDGSEYRWIHNLDKIFVIITSRHADAHIILANDRYDTPFSIKDDEHERRAAKYPHITNVFTLSWWYIPNSCWVQQSDGEFHK